MTRYLCDISMIVSGLFLACGNQFIILSQGNLMFSVYQKQKEKTCMIAYSVVLHEIQILNTNISTKVIQILKIKCNVARNCFQGCFNAITIFHLNAMLRVLN